LSKPVRLKYATSQAFDIAGLPDSYTYVRVKVQNIAFAKDVEIYFNLYGGTWSNQALGWIANFADYDLFGLRAPYTEEFVIKYVVNGETFWDNNNGRHYHLTNFTNAVGGNVMLNKAIARIGTEAGGGFVFTTSWVEGEVYVNNLSFGKQVGIRLSSDGGITWQDTAATFAGNITEGTFATSSGAEVWRFKTPELNINQASNTFQFAMYFRNLATGEMFWDNNFDQNYKLSKADGSTIA
jgi:hypothetical protein